MYERFFGLVDAPFRLTPDARYLFLSAKHADALAHLRLGLSESSGFVCITGDVGAGKTTLLRRFIDELGPMISVAYVFNPALSALELLQTINAEFGVPAASASRKILFDELYAHLLRQRQAGKSSLLVIDEAQALGMETLEQVRLLSNLETATEKLLRIVLVGQPQLRELLCHPDMVQLNQRITLRWHIGPLTRRESATYIHHRLRVASNGQVVAIFRRPALALVHRLSGGVPRLINMIAHRAMLAAFAADQRVVSVRIVRRAYGELASVPLPHRTATRWRAAAATLGAGVALGVFVLLGGQVLEYATAPLLSVDTATKAEPPASPPVAVAALSPMTIPAPPATDPVATSKAPPEATANAPVPLEVRLAGVDATQSFRRATSALLEVWQVRPLGATETVAPTSLDDLAAARGLGHAVVQGNGGLLRLLDLPALLELNLPAADGPRYVAVLGSHEDGWLLSADGQRLTVDSSFLDQHWLGMGHVLWRDFAHLGPTVLNPQTSGPAVRRLTGLLRQVGVYRGPEVELYDDAVKTAVREFQRSRRLVADGVVGPLTRLMLYSAARGFARPSLAATPGGTAS